MSDFLKKDFFSILFQVFFSTSEQFFLQNLFISTYIFSEQSTQRKNMTFKKRNLFLMKLLWPEL